MVQTTENVGKVTLSCRILPEQKLRIAKEAKDLGLSMCQYVEALVLKNHNELDKTVTPMDKQKAYQFENQFSDREENFYQSLLEELQVFHPESSENELVIGSLLHVLKNRNAWVQRDLSHYLKKVTEGKYDYIIEKTENK
jgi:hypothetical protein